MNVRKLDHLVLTVADITATVEWYQRVLGLEPVSAEGRHALKFGAQKINLHQRGQEFEPKARLATPSSADLCFLTDLPLPDMMAHWRANDVPIIEGPVPRNGAQGPILSVYCRDPDGNLIEVANPQ